MDTAFEQKVRERAYEIWVAAGMTDGMADAHWFSAQEAVIGERAPCEIALAGAAKPTKARAAAAKSAKRAVTSTAKSAKPKAKKAFKN